MLIATVVSQYAGSGHLVVRTANASKTMGDVLPVQGAVYSAGDQVVLARAPNEVKWIALAKIEQAPNPLAGSHALFPPSGFTTYDGAGFTVAAWDNWPGGSVCYEVIHNDTYSETDATTFYTRGSYFIRVAAAAEDRWFKLRAVHFSVETGQAYYSGWTEWKMGSASAPPTSITGMTDTPDTLGSANEFLRMNSGASALEWILHAIKNAADTPSDYGDVGQYLEVNAGTDGLEWATPAADVTSLVISMGDGSTVIPTGLYSWYIPVDFDGTIESWSLVADQAGEIVIDIWVDTTIPTNSDTITGGNEPELGSVSPEQVLKDQSVSGWTTALSQGDIIAFNVDSVDAITAVTLTLEVTKS